MRFFRSNKNMLPANGALAWLISKWQQRRLQGMQSPRRLVLIEHISLAPRQSLVMVEAEGRRLLIATSADHAPVFYSLNQRDRKTLSAKIARVS